MRVLKFFLYGVLFLCLFWMGLIVGGPFLIKSAVKFYFKDEISIVGVVVTPRLDVQIARMAFEISSSERFPEILGNARAINASWSLLRKQPFLKVSFGPTYFNDLGGLNSGLVTLMRNQTVTDEFPFHIELKGYVLKNEFSTDVLLADGILDFSSLALKDISFEISDVFLQNLAATKIEKINGSLNNVGLVEPLLSQFAELELKASLIESVALNSASANTTIKLSNKNGELDLKLEVRDLVLGTDGSIVELIQTELSYQISQQHFVGPLVASFRGVDIPDFGVRFDDFYSELRIQNERPEKLFNIYGKLQNFEYFNENLYVGRVKDSEVFVDLLQGETDRGSSAEIVFSANFNSSPHIKLYGKGLIDFVGLNDIAKCLYSECTISEIMLTYSVMAGQEVLSGFSVCTSNDCLRLKFGHELTVEHTANFFRDLMAAEILNPIFLAFIYSQVNSGVKNGSGHYLKF